MRSFTRGAAVLLAALVLIAVAAIAWRAISAEAPRRPVVITPSPTRTTAFPSAEPGYNVQLPLTVTEVSAGHKVSIKGGGPRQVAFTVTDDAMVVARLDCGLCGGAVTLTASDRAEPLLTGTAPFEGERLLASGDRRRMLVTVDAGGSWTLSLTSTRDLAAASGKVNGTGRRVVALAGPGSGVTVAGGTAYAFDPTTRAPLGSPGARLTVVLPAVLEVDAPGPWTLTPVR